MRAMSSGVNNGYCSHSSTPNGSTSPRSISTKPAFCSLLTKTRSARAPESQPAHAAGLVITSAGRSSSTTMSATTIRPPGLRIR